MNEYLLELLMDYEEETFISIINKHRKESKRNARKKEYYRLYCEESEGTSEEGIYDYRYQTGQERSGGEEVCICI